MSCHWHQREPEDGILMYLFSYLKKCQMYEEILHLHCFDTVGWAAGWASGL